MSNPGFAALLASHRRNCRVLALFCGLVFSLGHTAQARQANTTDTETDTEQTRAQLEQVQQEIQRISKEQKQREAQRGTLQRDLRSTELALGKLQKEQQASTLAIATTQSDITTLDNEERSLETAAAQQKEAVAAELREAYKRGDDNQLRLLLSEENPQDIARLLAYYRYILKARSERLDEYRQTIASILETQRKLQDRQQALEQQREALAAQEQALQKTRGQRQRLLANIDTALKDNAEILAVRKADRAELETLLGELEEALAQLIPDEDVEAFESARGSMRWPVEGRITQRFGRPRNQGKMRWQGVKLKAAAGAPVSAIHHGRVVYADWFRGMGLLIVVDHSDGYLSLYAHNQSLLREVGDWVSAGVAIATVGDSGGQGEAALYFEIRKDGKPTDPQRWCRS